MLILPLIIPVKTPDGSMEFAVTTVSSARPPIISDRLANTVYQVEYTHPDGPLLKEYGRNVFLFDGPEAEANAMIWAAELRTAGRPGVRCSRMEERRVRRQGEPIERAVYRWFDIS